eukprot:scaffold22662_cov22-Cyclotella_meneghiniana.AAC.1
MIVKAFKSIGHYPILPRLLVIFEFEYSFSKLIPSRRGAYLMHGFSLGDGFYCIDVEGPGGVKYSREGLGLCDGLLLRLGFHMQLAMLVWV